MIRHGQTDQLFNSNADIDKERQLTEEGKLASQKVGEYLRAFGISAIYSSPLSRTLQTAEIIKASAEIPGDIILDDNLLEMYHGKGEYSEREANVRSFFKELINRHAGKQLVLVSHMDPMEAYVEGMGFSAEDLDSPCLMSQGYRLVFAGDKPVECLKIDPSGFPKASR